MECCRADRSAWHLHDGFGRAKIRLWKHAERLIDRRCLERIHRVREIDAEFVVHIQLARGPDQGVAEIAIDTPVAWVNGVG